MAARWLVIAFVIMAIMIWGSIFLVERSFEVQTQSLQEVSPAASQASSEDSPEVYFGVPIIDPENDPLAPRKKLRTISSEVRGEQVETSEPPVGEILVQ